MYDDPIWKRILRAPLTAAQWLLELLGNLSQSFERGFRGFSSRLSGISEVADRGESALGNFASMIFRPFLALFRGVARISETIRLTAALKTLARWTRWLWYPLVALFGFLGAVLVTRRRQLIWWSVPLVLLTAPILFLILRVSLQQRGQITNRYRQALVEAIESRQFDQAQLFQQKLNQMGSRTEQLELQTADALIEEGKVNEAFELISKIAPLNEPGVPQAHIWMAQRLISGQGPGPDSARLERAQQHLQQARRSTLRDLPALDYLEAIILVRQDKLDAGSKMLDSVATQLLPAATLKLEVDLALGRTEDAAETAKAFLRLAGAEATLVETADAGLFRLWLAAEQLAGSDKGIDRVVQQWLSRFPEDPNAASVNQLRELGRLDALLSDPGSLTADQIVDQFLKIGNGRTPQLRQEISKRVMQILAQSPTLGTTVFQKLEQHPETPSDLLEVLGTQLVQSRDYGRARSLLIRATTQNATDFIAWNNLAYLIQEAFPGEMTAALQASNRAVELAPNDFNARETRGMIFLRLGRWEEAVSDLEVAINGLPRSRDIHAALATAYEKLGNQTLAKIHARKAEESQN